MNAITACSPAKIILSGEYSVLEGKAALALAINRYSKTTITYHSAMEHILFKLIDFDYTSSHTLNTLGKLAKSIRRDFKKYILNKLPINQVLKIPVNLLKCTVYSLMENANLQLQHGIELKNLSSIPVGCGMGSSAATIISTLYALSHYYKLNVSKDQLLSIALAAENLQHGQTSGLDLKLSLFGGFQRVEAGEMQKKSLGIHSLQLCNTGTPQASTGECVFKVKPLLRDKGLLNAFSEVTQAMEMALTTNAKEPLILAIRENQQLLDRIGVVPKKVQHFIQQIEERGGAAKVSGAGSVSGDAAGVLLMVVDENINTIVRANNYSTFEIKEDPLGVRIE